MALATPSAAAVQATSAEPVAHALSPAQAHLLTRIDLFARLDRVALARLAACAEALPIQAGEEVCRVGDLAEGLYVVAEGTFGVYGAGPERRGETRLGELRPGDFFGEMALLNDEPRSATVRAEGRGTVLQLERARFEELLRREPCVAHAVAAALSRRAQSRAVALGYAVVALVAVVLSAPYWHLLALL